MFIRLESYLNVSRIECLLSKVIYIFCDTFSARKRRPHHTQIISYSEKKVPTEPNTSAVHILQRKRVTTETIDQIKKVWNSISLHQNFLAIDFCSACKATSHYGSL